MSDVKVNLVEREMKSGNRYFYMRFRDPKTGKVREEKTGTGNRRKAERLAHQQEALLQHGVGSTGEAMDWGTFRDYYMDSKRASWAPATEREYHTALDKLERACGPKTVRDLTSDTIIDPTSALRSEGLEESTVAKHLRGVKAIAKWAYDHELLDRVPVFDMPSTAKTARAKGRPITDEEFNRMLAAVPSVVGEDAAPSWRLLLEGLWRSGLRLSEATRLSWDEQHRGIWPLLAGERSVYVFDAGSQKSGRSETVPMAPEMIDLLTSMEKPSGRVFEPMGQGGEPLAPTSPRIGSTIALTGKAAGVVVDKTTGKFASAHDLRRSFGARWSEVLMPAKLKQLMRHASIDTTMTYYVRHDAASVSAELRELANR